MSQLYSSAEELQRLRQRYENWAQAGFPGADPLVRQWAPLMAQLPGVVPVSSCQGHPMVVSTAHNPNRQLWFGMYFVWAIDAQGAEVLPRLHSLLSQELPGLCPDYWWQNLFASRYHRNNCLDEYADGLQSEYGCYTLYVAAMLPEQGERIQQALTRALQALLREHAPISQE